MKQYLALVHDILNNGDVRINRTGMDTLGVFGRQLRFNLQDGFPLLTTKKIHFKSVLHELLWFISGDTNVKYLNDNGVKIWNEWADENGNLGPIYGKQWRDFNGVDQLTQVIEGIKRNPRSRRHIVSAWNPAVLPDEKIIPQDNVGIGNMSLAPCHMMFQFNVRESHLDLQMYQRSVDVFLGLPFNIASYAVLLMMVARLTDYIPGEFVWVGGDTHIYTNHIDQIKEQLTRGLRGLPKLYINGAFNRIEDFKYEDFMLMGYDPHPHIKGEIAI